MRRRRPGLWKLTKRAIGLGTVALLVWINVALYHRPEPTQARAEILRQQDALATALKKHDLGGRLQRIYPEGYFFAHALYGLTWCELAFDQDADTQTIDQARREARFAWKRLDGADGRRPFSSQLQPAYGIFYRGWSNYLLSCVATLSDDSELKLRHLAESEAIAEAFRANGPFLPSYPGQVWPVDSIVAMASLAQYDLHFGSRYTELRRRWIRDLRQHLDPKFGLLPHYLSTEGKVLEGPRGESTTMGLVFLADVDAEFAREQYQGLQDAFAFTRMGLPAIRAYPKGRRGRGDIDSGPVVFDVGFSATIVGIAAHRRLGHAQRALRQFQTVHAFGFEWPGQAHSYLLGAVPIGDAFIAWARAQNLPSHRPAQPNRRGWRLPFHALSVAVILALGAGAWWMRRRESDKALRS